MKPGKCQIKYFEVDELRLTKTGKYAKVIELAPGSLFTRNAVVKYTGVDLERDILKAVAVECVKGSGEIGIGFLKGFGLTRGAVATTLTQGRASIIAVGKSDEDIASAIRRVAALGQGAVVVSGGMTMAELSLSPAEHLSNEAVDQTTALYKSLEQLGCRLADPLAVLALLTVTSIPELRLTPTGLYDPGKPGNVPLFE